MELFLQHDKTLTIQTRQELAREQLEMEKNTKFWVRVLFGLFDVWVVSAFKSRFVFGSSSVNLGFWVRLDLISSSMHLLFIN